MLWSAEVKFAWLVSGCVRPYIRTQLGHYYPPDYGTDRLARHHNPALVALYLV